jgi:hypothetical protein
LKTKAGQQSTPVAAIESQTQDFTPTTETTGVAVEGAARIEEQDRLIAEQEKLMEMFAKAENEEQGDDDDGNAKETNIGS